MLGRSTSTPDEPATVSGDAPGDAGEPLPGSVTDHESPSREPTCTGIRLAWPMKPATNSVRGRSVDLLGRAELLDATLVHHGDAVATS